MEYLYYILILSGIYVILSTSLNLIVGYTGLLSISHAAFYGIGAYIAALMALNLNTPFFLNIITAMLLSGLLGAFIGIPSIRIRDDYFVIASFAFQVITFSILNNWDSLTGGPLGLPGIPRPNIFGLTISNNLGFLLLVLFFCAFVLLFSYKIVKSPFGRVLKAIREDETIAIAAGKNVARFKILVFILGAGMASISGVMYAHYISFIDPTSFTVMESIFIITIVIIGGAGSLSGSIVGAIVMVFLPEILRFIGVPNSIAANLRQIFYGTTLVALMIWRPRGLLGDFEFKRTVSNAEK